MKRLLWTLAVFISGLTTVVRTSAQANPDQALLRVERLQPGQDICVLVEESGAYRLEKLFRAKAEIYTGTTSSARIEQLRSMLAGDALRKISQQDLPKPLISDTLDTVQLAIWRDRGWQELAFISPDSRKPFRQSLDPLLRWFEELVKERPAATRVEATPTRCLPPPVSRFVADVESSNGVKAAPVSNTAPQYLFRLYSLHFFAGEAEKTCAIVFGDGSYHWEHSNEGIQSGRRNRIAEGTLGTEPLQQLKTILDSPELKNTPGSSELGNPRAALEGTVTVLRIPRENSGQILYFSNQFNAVAAPNDSGGRSNMNYRLTDEKLLEPLQRWSKLYTNNRGHIDKDTSGNDCAPIGPVNSDKSSQ